MYDPLDERGVPVSRGTPMAVRIATLIGLLCIFGVGASVVMLAGYGHWWPDQKAMRIPLSNPNGQIEDTMRVPIKKPGPPRQTHPGHPGPRR
ncbi:MAG TPA: hypothetical protein VFW34_04900 [Candidatus Rubrimentiphilum sp.]|nr:hypothetical protein [Candidatus Rubrimentiphilum sp.]